MVCLDFKLMMCLWLVESIEAESKKKAVSGTEVEEKPEVIVIEDDFEGSDCQIRQYTPSTDTSTVTPPQYCPPAATVAAPQTMQANTLPHTGKSRLDC